MHHAALARTCCTHLAPCRLGQCIFFHVCALLDQARFACFFAIFELFARYALSPAIQMSFPFSDTCSAAVKDLCTGASLPEQDIFEPCSLHLSSFKSPEEFAVSPVAVLNFKGLFLQLWRKNFGREHRSCCFRVASDPSPARHLVLLREVEGAKSASACF